MRVDGKSIFVIQETQRKKAEAIKLERLRKEKERFEEELCNLKT